MKCKIHKDQEATWAWQPFGPAENIDSFALLGSHYRGFPVIKISDKAKEEIQAGKRVDFEYQGREYHAQLDTMEHDPGDAIPFEVWTEPTEREIKRQQV